MNKKLLTTAFVAAMTMAATAQNVMDVNTRKLGAPIQPTMYGIFFEDINYAADGGLYGELVKNRSFEFPQSLMGWQAFGSVELKNDGPFERCPHYVVLSDPGHNDRRTGLVNEGFFGGPRLLRARVPSAYSSSTRVRWTNDRSLQSRRWR